MDEFGYFLAAYIVVWAVIFGFILRSFRLQKNLNTEIEALKDELKSKKLGSH